MKKDNDFKKVKKAEITIDKVLASRNIKMPSTYYYKLGRFYAKTGKTEDAIREFEKAIKINKQKVTYYFSLAFALSKVKRYQEALRYFKKIIELKPVQTELTRALCQKGIMEGYLGKYVNALKTLHKVLNINRPPGCKKCPSLYSNLALSYQNIKNYSSAIKYYDKAIKLNPKDGDVWQRQGICYGMLGKYQEAIKCFDKAIKIAPKDIKALQNKYVALNYLGKYKLAMKVADRALKIQPNNEKILLFKSDMLNELGEYKESLKYINKVLKINPQNDIALTDKGSALCGLGLHAEELECYKKALKFNPKNHVAWSNYGCELIKKGKIREGNKCIEKAFKINPEYISIPALTSRAMAYIKQRKYKLAINDLNKIVSVDKKDACDFYNLACAYSLMNNINESLKMLKKAITLDKEYKTLARKDLDFRNIQSNKTFRKLVK